MAKFNALRELAERGMNPQQNQLAIICVLPIDENLFNFIDIQSRHLLLTQKGICNPSSEEMADTFLRVIIAMTNSIPCLIGASTIYDVYLNNGENALLMELSRLDLAVNDAGNVG